MKIEERQLKVRELRGQMVERAPAAALVFQLARQERDAWLNWTVRIAAEMAAELFAAVTAAAGQPVTVEPHTLRTVLDRHVRAHLAKLAEIAPDFGEIA